MRLLGKKFGKPTSKTLNSCTYCKRCRNLYKECICWSRQNKNIPSDYKQKASPSNIYSGMYCDARYRHIKSLEEQRQQILEEDDANPVIRVLRAKYDRKIHKPAPKHNPRNNSPYCIEYKIYRRQQQKQSNKRLLKQQMTQMRCYWG